MTVTLGAIGEAGTVYVARFTWRGRTASWYLDLFEADGIAAIVTGKRMSPGWAPHAGLVIETLPDGLLFVRGNDDFERDDLATDDLRLVFFATSELEAAAPPAAAPLYSTV
jgi:hypothetical protein